MTPCPASCCAARKPVPAVPYREETTMSDYIFRFPAGMPRLTFVGLEAYIMASPQGRAYVRRDIGTTVTVSLGDSFAWLRLYGLTLAAISRDHVEFGSTDDP